MPPLKNVLRIEELETRVRKALEVDKRSREAEARVWANDPNAAARYGLGKG